MAGFSERVSSVNFGSIIFYSLKVFPLPPFFGGEVDYGWCELALQGMGVESVDRH